MKNVLITIGFILLTGCTDNNSSAVSSEQSSDKKKSQQPPKSVNVISIKKQALNVSDILPGRVIASKTAQIRPQVSGIIQSRLYKEGSLVEKGQQLYQIESAVYEARFQSAEANLQNAIAKVDIAKALEKRYESLIEIDAVSVQEFENAKAETSQAEALVAVAQAELETAKINVDYTKVLAPISGYIGPSTVTIGALVTAQQQQAIATIRQLDPIYVDLSQSAAQAQYLQNSLKTQGALSINSDKFTVSLLLDNGTAQYPSKGTLYATDLAVDEKTGTIQLRAVFPNPDAILLPGMFVRASVEEAGTQASIVVPQQAVMIEPDGSKSVWVVDGSNMVRKQAVVTSASYNNSWIVQSGIQQGDSVVVEGLMMLRPGMKVSPTVISQNQNRSNNQNASEGQAATNTQQTDSTQNAKNSKEGANE
jgi:membrane fusion protein (multidrug efflux system)